MRESIEITGSENCPCGSEKRYSRCCKKKKFKWVQDQDGVLYKQTPMTEEVQKAIKESKREFKRIFRREPRDTDPVFPLVYTETLEDFDDRLIDLMEEAGIDPVLQYATQKTGRIVTRDNAKFLSDAELEEWNAAIDEYYRWEAAGFPPVPKSAYELKIEDVGEEFERLPYLYGMFLQLAAPARNKTRTLRREQIQRDISFYYATKSLKTLRAVDALLDAHLSEDALALTRTILENYLHVVFALERREQHEDWVLAKIGLETGTHTYAPKKDGTPNRGRIRESSTGKESPSQIRTLDMASASPYSADRTLWLKLYEPLSEYIHPHPKHILKYISDVGFDPRLRGHELDAQMLSRILVLMNLDALLRLGKHPRTPRRDVQVFLNACRKKLEGLFAALGDEAGDKELAAILHERVQQLGIRVGRGT